MLPAPCYIFGDTHLGFARDDVHQDVVAFLRHLKGVAGSVLINGDLFEFWYEWRTVVPRSAFRTLAALADLVDAGVPVVFIAGNHDCWGGDVLRRDVGVDYILGPWQGSIGGWKAIVEHGDGLRPHEDRKYRALRRVLRHPLSIRAFRWIHPDLAIPIASGSSHASRTHTARDGGRGLRDVAAGRLATAPSTNLVVFSHSHVAALERIGHGVYANPGSWLAAPTFLRVTENRIALRRWEGSAESSDLDALDHPAQESLPQLEKL